MWGPTGPECDILVSKLLGFESSRLQNFSNFLDDIGYSIKNNLVSKSVRFGIKNKFVLKKVLDSVFFQRFFSGISGIGYCRKVGFCHEADIIFQRFFPKILPI